METKTETDYLILYGKARRKITALEMRIDSLIERHEKEVQRLKLELLNPKVKAIHGDYESLINRLLMTVCSVCNVTIGQMVSGARERNIVTARHLFFYIGRNEFNFHWTKLTRLLGMNHTSAIHGADQYAAYLKLGYKMEKRLYDEVMALMKKGGDND
jgi:chromosomal replication initiation ATPase DnaA